VRRADCSAVVSSDLFLIREEFSSFCYTFRAGIAAFGSDFGRLLVSHRTLARESRSRAKTPPLGHAGLEEGFGDA
jgi:hypothetical protein